MLSSDPTTRIKVFSTHSLGRLALALITLLVLGSCTFAPVYGNRSAAETTLDMSFMAPATRLEQIIINELVARFGRSANPNAPQVKVVVSTSEITLGPKSVGLDALVTITDPITGEIIFSGTRSASASYTSSNQARANQQAANEAAERAAIELAETIRATLLGVMLNRQDQQTRPGLAVQ